MHGAGIVVAFFVIACGPAATLANAPTASATAARSTVLSASPSARPLGRVLGKVTLGMRSTQVLAALGEPAERTISHGLGSPEWHYASGLVVYLRFGTSPQDPDSVWRVTGQPPFDGATAEGLRLSDSINTFRQLYANVPLRNVSPGQWQYVDAQGTTLLVLFDADRVSEILIEGR